MRILRIKHTFSFLLVLFACLVAQGSISVKINSTESVGQKTVIKLTLKNTFKAKVESARATVFLMDDKGKVVGQGTKWIIGGTNDKPGLAANATLDYDFVVSAERPFTQTKIMINRVILEGGEVAEPSKSFTIEK